MKEYKRTLDDEIDWKIIDQLHSATVNFSLTSLEIKKLFIVLIGIAVPALIKLAGDKLDFSLFITLYLLIFTFWFLDGFTYFYQEKLREQMNWHITKIKNRNDKNLKLTKTIKPSFTLEAHRTKENRFLRSISNPSVKLYFIMSILNTIGLILFVNHCIE
jgi:hypothetical protein